MKETDGDKEGGQSAWWALAFSCGVPGGGSDAAGDMHWVVTGAAGLVQV